MVINHTSGWLTCCVGLIFYRCSRELNPILFTHRWYRDCLINGGCFRAQSRDPEGRIHFLLNFWKFTELLTISRCYERQGSEREGERVREEKVEKSKSFFRVQGNSMGDLGGNVLCCLLGALGSLVNREISGTPGFPIPHLSMLKNQDAFLSLGNHLYNPSCTHYLSPMVE